MGFIKVDLVREIAALDTLIQKSAQFLDHSSAAAWPHRKRLILAQINNEGPNTFRFGLGAQFKIQTALSTDYKGNGGNHPVQALFYFGWGVQRCPNDQRYHRVMNGGTNVVLRNGQGVEHRHFHYDGCPGGPHGEEANQNCENHNGTIAQHPPVHFQFHGGGLSDLPRVPTFLVSLADIFEQTLIELWPRDWPEHVQTGRTRQAFSSHHRSQQTRIRLVGERLTEMACSHALPLRGLQERLKADLIIA